MSIYKNICGRDLITMFYDRLQDETYIINADTGKIHNKRELNNDVEMAVDCPWMYTNNPKGMHCNWWRDIAPLFNFIPSHCLTCYKIVVRPTTVVGLYGLFKMQQKMATDNPDCGCKCGIEKRDYVRGNYGGYFYTRSLQAGLDRYKEVRQMVDSYIGPDTVVILKRACTEFELRFGPSDKWEETDNSIQWEKIIAEGCVMKEWKYKQGDLHRMKVVREWIKRAWSIDDPTVYELTDGEPLAPSCVTYHDMPEEQLLERLVLTSMKGTAKQD